MREYVISKNDSGQRLDKFIEKAIPRLPKSLLYKYIRIKRIKLNGKRCNISDILQENNIIQCYINDEFFNTVSKEPDFTKVPRTIDVVYEDNNILLVNKPAGLLVHEGSEWSNDTLIARIKHYLYHKNEYNPSKENSFVPSLCNRIDRNTCGIVIAAKNAATLRIMNEKIRNREICKKYLCVVKGCPKNKCGVLKDYLLKDETNNTVSLFSVPKEGAKTAITKYQVLCSHDNMSLVEAELITGRTHQIRAQFANIKCPLIGDTKYGKSKDGHDFTWQALCSYKTTFDFKTDSEHLNYLNGKSFNVKNAWFLEKLGFEIPY